MEPRLTALKLFLEAMGVPSAIDTVDDRKRVQKAVYIGQLVGPNLGYRFSWYVKGPYSTALTRDYYAMAENVASGSSGEEPKLKPAITAKLAGLRPLLQVPSAIKLPQEDWLELLASLHFLRNVSGKSETEARAILDAEKPHVSMFVDQAKSKMEEFGLQA